MNRYSDFDKLKIHTAIVIGCAGKECLIVEFAGQVVCQPWARIESMWVIADHGDGVCWVKRADRFDGGNSRHTGTNDDVSHEFPLMNKSVFSKRSTPRGQRATHSPHVRH